MKFKSDNYTETHGSIGGTVFKTSKGKMITSSKSIPNNKRTVIQNLRRADFSFLTQIWKDLTQEERYAWIKNENFKLAGKELFHSVNSKLLLINKPIITIPPSPDFPPIMKNLSMDINKTTSQMNITSGTLSPIDCIVVFSMSRYLSLGNSADKKEVQFVHSTAQGFLISFDIAPQYIEKFGLIPPLKSRVFITAYTVNEFTGLASQSISSSAVPHN